MKNDSVSSTGDRKSLICIQCKPLQPHFLHLHVEMDPTSPLSFHATDFSVSTSFGQSDSLTGKSSCTDSEFKKIRATECSLRGCGFSSPKCPLRLRRLISECLELCNTYSRTFHLCGSLVGCHTSLLFMSNLEFISWLKLSFIRPLFAELYGWKCH